MRSEKNCIPCIEKQLRNELAHSPNVDMDKVDCFFANLLDRTIGDWTPVQISLELHDLLVEAGGSGDPYSELKRISNENAKALLPLVESLLGRSKDRIRTAAIASTAGNVIDYGAKNLFDLRSILERSLEKGLAKDRIGEFESDLSRVQRLNVIADNSGECVMDNVLMREVLMDHSGIGIYYWVKRSPILNDVTREDALEAGVEEGSRLKIVRIAGDGWISDDEIDSMEGIVLSKGQGNYETLSEKEGIYFSLAVKCEVVASHIGVDLGDLVFFKR